MNQKGFTLTELIVTMALLGVISAIAFPAITKLQTQNQKQMYKTYEKALLNGAKLYVDKYGRDLWDSPVTDPTCVIITYKDLTDEDLIKPFNGMKKKEQVNDDKDKTYVLATKNDNSVTYIVSLEVIIPENNSITHSNTKDKEKKEGKCTWQNIRGENTT